MNTAGLVLLGGLAIFVHGLDQAKRGLQQAAGDRLRKLIGAMTANRVQGAGAGFLFTVVIQSSTAVSLMVIDYCGAGMCSFSEALAVLLGAGLGTTVIVQLIMFSISAYALLLVALGVAVQLMSRAAQAGGRILVGLGMLFFGLEVMAKGVEPLLRGPVGTAAVGFLASQPVLSVLAAAVVTVMLQGSAPTIGLVAAVAASGHLSLTGALPFVLGANIGTTITPLIYAWAKPVASRRAAIGNIAIKIAGAALALPFLPTLGRWVSHTAASPTRQLANAHTLYNLVLMLGGTVFLTPISRAVERFYSPAAKEPAFHARHLSPEAVETPALAFAQAVRELLNMAAIVGEMLRAVSAPLLGNMIDDAERIEAEDDKVDVLNREIRFYLARLGSDRMSDAQGHRRMRLINICSDLESIGDVITRSLVPLARKRVAQAVSFSDPGKAELSALLEQVAVAFDTAVSALATSDEGLGRTAERMIGHIEVEEARLRRSHIERLQRSDPASLGSSSIHLDVLTDLARVAGLCESMVEATAHARAGQAGAA